MIQNVMSAALNFKKTRHVIVGDEVSNADDRGSHVESNRSNTRLVQKAENGDTSLGTLRSRLLPQNSDKPGKYAEKELIHYGPRGLPAN